MGVKIANNPWGCRGGREVGEVIYAYIHEATGILHIQSLANNLKSKSSCTFTYKRLKAKNEQ